MSDTMDTSSMGVDKEYDKMMERGKAIRKAIKASSKKAMIKDIEDSIKMVESIKVPKKSKSKNISMALDLVEQVSKAPKTKKIKEKEIESINESIAEVEKLLKTPKKGLKKLIEADKEHLKFHPSKQDYKEMKMDQKAYKHKAKNVSDLVSNYVTHFKSILSENKVKGGIMTKGLKAIRTKFYDMASPSEIDDANSLIKEYRSMLPPKETKAGVPKVKKVKPDDNSYAGHIKYKPLTLYVKKHRPDITDPEDINIIVQELINKAHPRMSVTKLKEVLDDLGFNDISGTGVAPKSHEYNTNMLFKLMLDKHQDEADLKNKDYYKALTKKQKGIYNKTLSDISSDAKRKKNIDFDRYKKLEKKYKSIHRL